MAEESLAIYLNDHLSGAVAVVSLLEHVEQARAGSPEADFARDLRAEIEADKRELENLMDRLGVAKSRTRATASWLAEKGAEMMLRMDDPAAGALRLLEAFEAVTVGIEGKRLLWRALSEAEQERPELAGTNYAHLEHRAEDQRCRVERRRVKAAIAAITGSTVTTDAG